jgi:hypothetical protein
VAVLLGTACIVCCIFLCLELKEDDKTFGSLITPHLYGNYVALFSGVLCNWYRICFGSVEWGVTESEPSVDDVV